MGTVDRRLGIPPEGGLSVTFFRDEKGEIAADQEAAAIWRTNQKLDPCHVLLFGRKENFWEMAELAPAARAAKSHFDRGEETCNRKTSPATSAASTGTAGGIPNSGTWFSSNTTARTEPARAPARPARGYRDGPRADRLGPSRSQFHVPYRYALAADRAIAEVDRPQRSPREANFTPYRVMADHARAAAFLIADGVVPGQHRAQLHLPDDHPPGGAVWRKLGLQAPFLAKIAGVVVANYAQAYPELVQHREAIYYAIRSRNAASDDSRHRDRRSSRSDRRHETQGRDRMIDDIAFNLYATFGLPLESPGTWPGTWNRGRRRGIPGGDGRTPRGVPRQLYASRFGSRTGHRISLVQPQPEPQPRR